MSAYIDPSTALAIARQARADEIRRARARAQGPRRRRRWSRRG
jgi:hypothetical protein